MKSGCKTRTKNWRLLKLKHKGEQAGRKLKGLSRIEGAVGAVVVERRRHDQQHVQQIHPIAIVGQKRKQRTKRMSMGMGMVTITALQASRLRVESPLRRRT